MAYVYPADEAVGKQMCGEGEHHWHMMNGEQVACCRCDATESLKNQVSMGPHDNRGDA